MKAVRVHTPGSYSIDEVPFPVCGPRDALVRVAACGICGSDLHFVNWGSLRADGLPMALGHEATGIVEAVGSKVDTVTPGMRVFINPTASDGSTIGAGIHDGAFASHVVVPDAALGKTLLPIPEGVGPHWSSRWRWGCTRSTRESRGRRPRLPSSAVGRSASPPSVAGPARRAPCRRDRHCRGAAGPCATDGRPCDDQSRQGKPAGPPGRTSRLRAGNQWIANGRHRCVLRSGRGPGDHRPDQRLGQVPFPPGCRRDLPQPGPAEFSRTDAARSR